MSQPKSKPTTNNENMKINVNHNLTSPIKPVILLVLVMFVSTLTIGAAAAQTNDVSRDDPLGIRLKPRALDGTGVDSKTGETIDPDIPFYDHDNRFVRIGDYFDDKPVLLSFNYSNCPKLCSVQLENMVQTLAKVKFRVGTDFEMVSVSIDPLEQTSRAREYVHMYNQGESVDGFHFLTGEEEAIEYLAELCGFRYKYIAEQKLYSHPPVFIMVSPKGKIVRYIHGLDYDPVTIERALIETAEGKIGSPINLLAYGIGCFVFDESRGKYTFQAMAIMRAGGLLTIFGLVVGLVPYWFYRSNRAKNEQEDKEATNLPTSDSNSSGDFNLSSK